MVHTWDDLEGAGVGMGVQWCLGGAPIKKGQG